MEQTTSSKKTNSKSHLLRAKRILYFVFFGMVLVSCVPDSGNDTLSPTDGDSNTDRDSGALTEWTESTPTAYDNAVTLTDLTQPGSRLIYISSSGSDASGELYFWDGTNIVDSSGSTTGSGAVAYGTDPFNPTGPIQPFQRWSYVAPRPRANQDIGTPWNGENYLTPGWLQLETRYEYPDWWLFKRGDTFDLYQDYLSFVHESNPGYIASNLGTGTLAVTGGRSATERQIVGAYGDLADPRPRFINPPGRYFIERSNELEPKHIAYLSLHFDGRTDRRGGGINITLQGSMAKDILLEDIWIDGTTGNIVQNTSAEVTIRRSLLTDTFRDDGSHVSGLFFAGNSDAKFRIEQSIILRNGFTNGDPQVTGWPPPNGGQDWNIFNRNLYLSGECNHLECGVFDTVSMLGASGDQFRPGMRIDRNFFYQGYVEMGGHGGYADSHGPTGTMYDNVLQRFNALDLSTDTRGHPGWGLHLTSGAYMVEVSENIVTGAQYAARDYGFLLDPLNWFCYNDTFHYATRQNRISNNIFDSGSASAAIRIVDGVIDEATPCANWTYRGVTDNEFATNVLINDSSSEYEYAPVSDAVGTTNDTVYTDNRVYTSRSNAAIAEGWSDPERTLKSYLESLGHDVVSDDGFVEYFNLAVEMRRGAWNTELTARSIVNYFRNGFGMADIQESE